MRCLACNVPLNDAESSRKFSESGQYVDLCNKCNKWMPDDVNTVINPEHEDLEFDVDYELASIDNEDLFNGWSDDDESVS